MNADYIKILKANSKLKDRKDYPVEVKLRVREAMKQMELELSAQEIIENTREAFKKPAKTQQTTQ